MRKEKYDVDKSKVGKGWITPANWIMTKCVHCGAWTGRRSFCHMCKQNPTVLFKVEVEV